MLTTRKWKPQNQPGRRGDIIIFVEVPRLFVPGDVYEMEYSAHFMEPQTGDLILGGGR